MSDGLSVTLNDKEFASEASEVHIIDHAGPLPGYLVHRLTTIETDNQKMLPAHLRQDMIKGTGSSQRRSAHVWDKGGTNQYNQLLFLGVVGDAEGSDGLLILLMC